MPRIKSLLNGEVSNVRGDIAKELIRMGVAVALDPLEETEAQRKGRVVLYPNGTVEPDGEPAYRLPKPSDAINPPKVQWSIDFVASHDPGIKWVAIRRDIVRGNTTDTSHCLLPPKSVHDREDHNHNKYCSAFGCPVPKEILEQYRRTWEDNPNAQAPFQAKFKPFPDEKSDKAAINTAVSATTARGVLDGQLQMGKPGSRIGDK